MVLVGIVGAADVSFGRLMVAPRGLGRGSSSFEPRKAMQIRFITEVIKNPAHKLYPSSHFLIGLRTPATLQWRRYGGGQNLS